MPDYQHLLVETTADGVRTITLDRPDRLNAVNGALASSMGDALADAGADDAVRVVVITGNGRAFCAGLDLSQPPEIPSATRADRLDPYAWVGTWVQRVVDCEKPVIAAVNGPAAGAGFGLALACDIRLVASSAKLTAGYVRRGLSPDAGVSYFLPRHVGLARAADILLSGRDVDAAEALLIGLATMVIPDAEFPAAVSAYASRLALGATDRAGAHEAAARAELRPAARCDTSRRAHADQGLLRDAGCRRGDQGIQREAPAHVQGNLTTL